MALRSKIRIFSRKIALRWFPVEKLPTKNLLFALSWQISLINEFFSLLYVNDSALWFTIQWSNIIFLHVQVTVFIEIANFAYSYNFDLIAMITLMNLLFLPPCEIYKPLSLFFSKSNKQYNTKQFHSALPPIEICLLKLRLLNFQAFLELRFHCDSARIISSIRTSSEWETIENEYSRINYTRRLARIQCRRKGSSYSP